MCAGKSGGQVKREGGEGLIMDLPLLLLGRRDDGEQQQRQSMLKGPGW